MADGIFTVVKATDPRLKAEECVYTASQGASAISVVSTNAASPNTSVLTWSVVPPSPQVVIQKTPLMDIELIVSLQVLQSNGCSTAGTFNNGTFISPLNTSFAQWGRDFAVARAAPLGQLVNSYNIQINNAAVQQQNVSLPDLVHVLEGPRGRASRGTTFRTPLYASWNDASGTTFSLNSEADMQGDGDAGPGSFDVKYCCAGGGPADGYTDLWSKATPGDLAPAAWPRDAAGMPIPPDFPAAMPADGASGQYWYCSGTTIVPIYRGQPLTTGGWSPTATPFLNPGGGPPVNCAAYKAPTLPWNPPTTVPVGGNIGNPVPILIRMRLIDVLMCSPFGFSVMESFRETGLYGISSMLVNAQLTDAITARLIQGSGLSGCVVIPNTVQLVKVTTAKLWMTYLSPSVTSDLPPQSVASLCNIQYFQQPFSVTSPPPWVAGMDMQKLVVNFNSVTFSNVPDIFLISVRPMGSAQMSDEADWCCTLPDGAVQQFTFANQSGLFSGFTSERLSAISRNNGSKASLAQYGSASGSGYFMTAGRRTQAGGSILVLRPGIDFPLPVGVSVGSTGQVQLNFQLQVNVPGQARQYQCTVTALSSAFFVTNGGVSRQLLVGLDEDMVLGAPEGPSRYVTQKLVGGSFWNTLSAGFKHALSNPAQALSGAVNAYKAAKSGDYMGALGHAAGAAGYGSGLAGSGVAGGGLAGGAMAGQKRRYMGGTLASRLQC